MEQMLDLTVAMPTKNRHRYFPQVISEFSKQQFKGTKELILFDDTEHQYPYTIDHPEIVYTYHATPLSIDEKRNKINRIARGKIIVCMDDDDVYVPTYLQHMVDLIYTPPLPSLKIGRVVGAMSTVIYNCMDKTWWINRRNPNHNRAIAHAMAYDQVYAKNNLFRGATGEEASFLRQFKTRVREIDHARVGVMIWHPCNTVNKTDIGKTQLEENDSRIPINLPRECFARLNDMYPTLFWINLDVREDRRVLFLDQFKTGSIVNMRVPAIRPTYEIQYHTGLCTETEIACFRSHIRALSFYLKQSDSSYAIICEDDIVLPCHELFYEQLHYFLRSAPADWEMLQLHTLRFAEHASDDIDGYEPTDWRRREKADFSTCLYMVRRERAVRLVKEFENTQNFYHLGRVSADSTLYKDAIVYTSRGQYYPSDTRTPSSINPDHETKQVANNERIAILSERYPYPFSKKNRRDA
jgi:GR25 family glycosyltransferase involved in LPS biosynthesis